MNKILSIILSLTMLTAVGCSKKDSSTSQSDTSAAGPLKASQLNYKETDLDLPEDFSSTLGVSWHSGLRLYYTDNESQAAIQLYDDSFAPTEKVTLAEPQDDRTPYISDRIPAMLPDGGIAILYTYAVWEGDYSDMEAYFSGAAVSFRICRFDAEGKLTADFEADGISEFYTLGDTYIESMTAYGDSYIIRHRDGYALIGADGSLLDSVVDSERYSFTACADGSFIAAGWETWGYMDGTTLKFPDQEREYGKWLSLSGSVYPGAGDYKAFLWLSGGIFGLRYDDTLIQLMGTSESNVYPGIILSLTYAGEGKFALLSMDQTTGTGMLFMLLTVRPEDYVDDRTPVTVGCINWDNNADETVAMYNKQSDLYIADIKKYETMDDLKLDVLSGDQPDLVCYHDSSTMYKYTNLGAFADIYTLMDSRDGLSRDDIVPNVLKAYEYKGGLYGLPVAFNYELWIANSDVISRDYSLWTVSDFLSIAENMPEGMYLGSRNSSFTDRKVAWYNFFDLLMYNYVDFDSYTCDFSSPEFLQVLDLLGSFEVNEPYDWDNADDETSTQYFLEANRALSEQTALIGYAWLHRFLSFAETPGQYNLLEHDNYTYLIPPSNDGRGRIMTGNCMCYSILSNAKNADGAWDYFCYIMGERYQTSYLQTGDTFTSNKAGYDKKLNKFMEDSRYMVYYRNGGTGVAPDEFELVDGELVYTGDTAEKFGHPLDESNKEYILSVLDSCDVLMDSDDTIQSIANEEVEKYLAGEQTAQQCAEMLQNRISLYLGEIS